MNLPAAVETVGALRICEHGLPVTYRAQMERIGRATVAALVAAADRRGLNPEPEHNRATCTCHVLDLIDGNGDIVGDRCVPAEAWSWWRNAAGPEPVETDCRDCEPEAWQATDPTRRSLAS